MADRVTNFDTGQPQALKDLSPASVMGASGASHAQGLVPDPGSVAGTGRFLREDGTWSSTWNFGGTTPIAFGPDAAGPTYNGIALNGNLSGLTFGTIGFFGGGGVDTNLYLSGGSFSWWVNAPGSRQVMSLDNGGNLVVAGTITATGGFTGQNIPTIQRFTSGSAATYTPAAGIKYIRVRMIAGGGGGGAGATNSGAQGGTTSFGGWTCIGGLGGAPSLSSGGAGGSGGATGTGTLVGRWPGGGGGAFGGVNGVNNVCGGAGGNGIFGGGAQAIAGSAAGVAGGTNTGGGGSGGSVSASTSNGSGGGAGEGVEFIMTAAQVGASLLYTVGGGGNGGTAGTQAGGKGADGQIIVEEFYV